MDELVAPTDPSSTTSRSTRAARSRRSVRLVVAIGYGVAFVAVTALTGLPASRDRVSLWLLGALLVASIAQPRGWARVLRDFLPLIVVLYLYDIVRGLADGLVGRVFTYPQLRVDEWLFGGTAPTITLQRWFWTPGHLHLLDYAAFAVYLSYFIVPLSLVAVLYIRSHELFRRFVWLWVGLTTAAVVTYALYPASPPWLASQEGHLAHVARITPMISREVGVDLSRMMASKTFVNRVAAVPSLHAATALLIAMFLWPIAGRWRWLLAVYPVAMGFSLVYLGEHYVSDVLLGYLYAVVVFLLGNRITRRRSERRHLAEPAAGSAS
jgi:membrane-associated phospholipid phosphatase